MGKPFTEILEEYANMIDDVTMYQKNVRYVRILGYTKVESGSGVGINELSVMNTEKAIVGKRNNRSTSNKTGY